MKKLNSKLFENNIIEKSNLSDVKGGGLPNTQYKDGRPDTSSSSDGDKCWSIGTKDTETDCSSIDLGGDELIGDFSSLSL